MASALFVVVAWCAPALAQTTASDAPLDRDASMDTMARAAAVNILRSLDYRYQEQLTLTRATLLPSGRLGLIELGVAASFFGIGASVGAGFERVPDLALMGGYGLAAADFRPLALTTWTLADQPAFHWLDPSLSLGVRLGGLVGDGEPALRAAMTLGAGIDVAWATTSTHPVITLRYRTDLITAPVHEPESTIDPPTHMLLMGVGIRSAD